MNPAEPMHICIFGNGNIRFEDFLHHYGKVMEKFAQEEHVSFLVCEFRGTDVLALEFLKCRTPRVHIFHIGERPRYLPDAYKTFVSEWRITGGFRNDTERDFAAIEKCTHYIAEDFNSDQNRKSGTLRNMERCNQKGKIRLMPDLA